MDSCSPNLTASCQRVCTHFEALSTGHDSDDLGQLIFVLLAEESIGGACLHRLGLTMDVIATGSLGSPAADSAKNFLKDNLGRDDLITIDQEDSSALIRTHQSAAFAGPTWYIVLRDRASIIAKKSSDGPPISSEHLVMAMTEVEGFVKKVLQQHGIQHQDVLQSLDRIESPVCALDVDLTLNIDEEAEPLVKSETACRQQADSPSVTNHVPQQKTTSKPPSAEAEGSPEYHRRVHALLDANLNRAREGLRVIEDCARFVLCCTETTSRLKTVRHNLVEAELQLRARHPLIQLRDVESDAGTCLTTTNEQRRSNLRDIVTANCRRMQEAIRSLEEFGKLVDGQFSEACKQLRYQTYQTEQMLEHRLARSDTDMKSTPPHPSRSRIQREALLNDSQLYVLMTEEFCAQPWQQTAEAVLTAGADVIQLREKKLAHPELRRRAAWLRDLCQEHQALFIINDNAELAVDINADGVHVGQTDLAVADVRKIIHQDQLLGLSTHDPIQLQEANGLNVDYVGVGPMFLTDTKSFEEYSGPAYATQAAKESTVPWFAIGGIQQHNLAQLIEVGVRRIAVCGAVLAADSASEATHHLKRQLLSANTRN
ncbi:MAG: thiamine phosphate synthase [Fuerstiella sp.]